MRISCEVIRDLLPLYHDNVCSEDSCKLVDEHLATCSKCKIELEKIDTEIKVETNIDDVKAMKRISQRWKKDRVSAFLMGSLLLSVLACIGCGVSYNIIGCYVAEDGRLVEPFALIPLFYIFGFIALISGIVLGITYIVRHKKN